MIKFIFLSVMISWAFASGSAIADWKLSSLVFPGYCPWGAVKAGVCRTTSETFDATEYLKTTGKVTQHVVNVAEFPCPCDEDQTFISGAEFVISWGTGRRQSMRYVLVGDHRDADGQGMSVDALMDNPDRITQIRPTMDESHLIANFDQEVCVALLDTEMVDASYPFRNTTRRVVAQFDNTDCSD